MRAMVPAVLRGAAGQAATSRALGGGGSGEPGSGPGAQESQGQGLVQVLSGAYVSLLAGGARDWGHQKFMLTLWL